MKKTKIIVAVCWVFIIILGFTCIKLLHDIRSEDMAYSKTIWANGTTPAINADNLNKIEQGVYDAVTEVEDVRTGADGTTYASAGDAVRGQVTNLKNVLDYIKKQMIESSTFDLSYLVYTNDGYFTLGTALTTTHTNFVWFRNSKNKNIINIPVEINSTYNNARICMRDKNGTIIYFVLNVANGYYKINAYNLPAVAVLNTPINTNVQYDVEYKNHKFGVVLIGYTAFLYFDDIYVGNINCTNKIGDEIDALGVGFRGNLGNNSYYGNPKIDSVGAFAHFSFDDQLAVLKDLTDNALTYNSIFDNTALAGLKELHDTYGCVYTLMLFYQDDASSPTFTLNNVTTKFKNEFIKNSGWLKMAYHGQDPSTHAATEMTTQELVNSVKAVYDAIETFAGVCCIDKVPRISYFNCTKEQALALKEAGYIQGLLTADDNRNENCGLDSAERAVVQNYDMYIDYKHEISYFRTELRIDNTSVDGLITAYNNLYNSLNNHKQFIIFGHGYEGERLTKLQTIAEWCFKHNMKFDYPVNYLGY